MKRLLAFLLFTVAAFAQTHSVTLTWTDTLNPSGTNYNAYRLNGACPGGPGIQLPNTTGFQKLNSSPLATMTYKDTSVVAGQTYCYLLTSVTSSGTGETGPSVDSQAVVPGLFPPTMLQTVPN